MTILWILVFCQYIWGSVANSVVATLNWSVLATVRGEVSGHWEQSVEDLQNTWNSGRLRITWDSGRLQITWDSGRLQITWDRIIWGWCCWDRKRRHPQSHFDIRIVLSGMGISMLKIKPSYLCNGNPSVGKTKIMLRQLTDLDWYAHIPLGDNRGM